MKKGEGDKNVRLYIWCDRMEKGQRVYRFVLGTSKQMYRNMNRRVYKVIVHSLEEWVSWIVEWKSMYVCPVEKSSSMLHTHTKSTLRIVLCSKVCSHGLKSNNAQCSGYSLSDTLYNFICMKFSRLECIEIAYIHIIQLCPRMNIKPCCLLLKPLISNSTRKWTYMHICTCTMIHMQHVSLCVNVIKCNWLSGPYTNTRKDFRV